MTGGIHPPKGRRSRLALTMSEREEISRGIVAGWSIRSIAIGAEPSTLDSESRVAAQSQPAALPSQHSR